MQDSYRQDSARLSSKEMSTKGGLHFDHIDLGTTDRRDPYTEISNPESRNGGDYWSPHQLYMTNNQRFDAGEV